MKGIAFHKGSVNEQSSRKLSGRQCTYMEVDKKGGKRQCSRKTGKNYFFCKEHHGTVSDYGMHGVAL